MQNTTCRFSNSEFYILQVRNWKQKSFTTKAFTYISNTWKTTKAWKYKAMKSNKFKTTQQ